HHAGLLPAVRGAAVRHPGLGGHPRPGRDRRAGRDAGRTGARSPAPSRGGARNTDGPGRPGVPTHGIRPLPGVTTLSLQGLTWHPYSRAEPTVAGLDLKIPAGQRVLLTGPSGSGKSTVLRALAGLLDEESGELAGSAPGPARPGERGLLLQNPLDALIPATGGRGPAFGPENPALPREEIQRPVTAPLDAAHVAVGAGRARGLRRAAAGAGPGGVARAGPRGAAAGRAALHARCGRCRRGPRGDRGHLGRAHPGDRRAPHRTVAGPRGPPGAARRA